MAEGIAKQGSTLRLDDRRRHGVGNNVEGKVETKSAHVRLRQGFISAMYGAKTSIKREAGAPKIKTPLIKTGGSGG